VHPGPGRRTGTLAAGDEAPAHEPPWWQALTGYVSQMQAAWLAFATAGRARHPGLTVVFSMLAGGAPLLSERLQTRRGPLVDLNDPLRGHARLRADLGRRARQRVGYLLERGSGHRLPRP
jgi:hypothetical protein